MGHRLCHEERSAMKRISVTIIGVGPRGLSVLERIAAMAGQHQLLLDVALVEPGECGPGVHGARQPQHLLINTIASQVTVFPADGMVQPAPVCATPSLTQWGATAATGASATLITGWAKVAPATKSATLIICRAACSAHTWAGPTGGSPPPCRATSR